MTRSLTRLTAASLALAGLTACVQIREGTQIGVEESLTCEQVSSEILDDLDAAPEDFTRSPQEAIDALTGTFSGPQLAEEDAPTDGWASATVADAGGEVALLRYEAIHGGDEDLSERCPPRYAVALDFTLEADGLPGFQGALDALVRDDGQIWVAVEDPAFDEPLPEPATFDPDDFDQVVSRLKLSGDSAGLWSVTLRWEAMNEDEVEPDGDYPVTDELLLMADLELE